MKKPIILVIDGMGGGIGKSVIEKLKHVCIDAEVVAVGTNPIATKAMESGGADVSVTGENSLLEYVGRADIIVGVMGMLIPGGLKGELTSSMVTAISACSAVKVLIPMNRCGMKVAAPSLTLAKHIEMAVNLVLDELDNINN